MSPNFGEQIPSDPMTLRGRDWPCLRQFCVFLENKVGLLNDLLRHLEKHDLKVMALCIADSVDFALARIIMSEYERSKELLELSNFTIFENDIIGVELPDDDQPYVSVCNALLQAEVNINYTYPLMYRRQGHSGIALHTEDIDEGIRALKRGGLKLITENDLKEDDRFFLG
ncbi:MAG: acetolactate synthase [Planctomycetaceae bacterium]